MNKIIYRRANKEEYAKIIILQSNIFHNEQGIPEDNVEEFLARNPICWCAELDGKITGEPQSFYEGNVTPVVLKRENFK